MTAQVIQADLEMKALKAAYDIISPLPFAGRVRVLEYIQRLVYEKPDPLPDFNRDCLAPEYTGEEVDRSGYVDADPPTATHAKGE